MKKIKVSLLLFYYIILNRSLFLKKQVTSDFKWFGNNYGGFYLNPVLLNENSIVYSIGIGEDVSFDLDVIKFFNCNVYGFDPTPKSISWVKSQNLNKLFVFNDYGISKYSGFVKFYLPQNKNHVSGSSRKNSNLDEKELISVPMKSFLDIVNSYNHTEIDILKIDIEGSEYDVLFDILKSGIVIKQILIEFHHRMFKNGARLTKESIKLLNDFGYKLFAFSDSHEELSFIHENYLKD
jgi:FkbM family methyltransferase